MSAAVEEPTGDGVSVTVDVEPPVEPVVETPDTTVVVVEDSGDDGPNVGDATVGAVIDHAEAIAELRATQMELAAALAAIAEQQQNIAITAGVALEQADLAQATADEAANPPVEPNDDEQPARHGKFHEFMFGHHMGREI